MKNLLFTVICCTLLAAGAVYAEEHEHGKMPAPATAPATKPVNSMCVVETDHPVDDRAVIIYQGKAIGFCCEDCMALFKKNPEKYLENAK